MIRCVFIIAIFFGFGQIYAQISENFSDPDLTSGQVWLGDLDDFVVNADGELQLLAAGGGESTLYTACTYQDSMMWRFEFLLDFSPSTSNLLTIYLQSDQADLKQGSGYLLEIGESGIDDAIRFFRQDAGVRVALASGELGAVGGNSARARLSITKNSEGLWVVKANYQGEPILAIDAEFMDNTYTSGAGFFGIYCKYSSTRTDKYFFDDIEVGELVPDITPPSLVSASLDGDREIVLIFDEALDESSALNTANYSLSNGLNSPQSASFEDGQANVVRIIFGQALQGGIVYTLDIDNVRDLSGNIIETQAEIFKLDSAAIGDLLVNEILFNPVTGGSDFVEIYNNSTKYIDLKHISIRNIQNGQQDLITAKDFIEPFSYLAITDAKDFILENFSNTTSSTIIQNDIPSFNNDAGNVSIVQLLDGDEEIIDYFDYNEDMHFELLRDLNGVSLERIRFDVSAQSMDNWHSAGSAVGFATPGYKNSSFIDLSGNLEEMFVLNKKVFSPNQDGTDDVMIIEYSLDNPGYTLNAKVFDASGHFIADIARNELLGSNGIVQWDGIDSENQLADIGIYVIWIELFQSDGQVIQHKLTTVLADQLE